MSAISVPGWWNMLMSTQKSSDCNASQARFAFDMFMNEPDSLMPPRTGYGSPVRQASQMRVASAHSL